MPSDRTTVTELGTGLGMLGLADVDDAVRSRTPVMHSLSPEMWERLTALRAGGAFDAEFHAAWANGQAFLAAEDGLRGRLPKVVEWKGTGRAPGDEVAPIDLRVDHVYLVSCKYLSQILFNVSPWNVFDGLLIGAQARGGRAARDVLRGGGDWYAEVAPAEYQALYEAVRLAAFGWDDREPASRARAATRTRRAVGPGARSTGATGTRCHRHDRAGPARRPATVAPAALLRDLPARAADLSSARARRPGALARRGLAHGRQGPLRHPVAGRGSGVGTTLGGSHAGRAPGRARPCCGACCASGAPPTSSSAPRRRARCACASRRRGTGAGSTGWSPST